MKKKTTQQKTDGFPADHVIVMYHPPWAETKPISTPVRFRHEDGPILEVGHGAWYMGGQGKSQITLI